MITRVEALGYRCLRYVSQPLEPFHVLVGPNASGKTTFLDVVAFLGRLVSDGPDAAIEERTQNFYDLVWRGKGTQFELAIEAQVPAALQPSGIDAEIDTVRYEVTLSIDSKTQERGLYAERVILKKSMADPQSPGFPKGNTIPLTLSAPKDDGRQSLEVLDRIYSEVILPGFGPVLRRSALGMAKGLPGFGPRQSMPGNLPGDESIFSVILWLREILTSGGVQPLTLNSALIRRASPPGQGLGLRSDGSNLPWVVADLRQKSPERFRQWIAHLQTAFPDLQDINTIERPEDRHRYLVLQYGEGLEVPSWMASDGTLRMLALTLPAYLEGFKGIYLIEEPENGIHPRAIETMTQSLSSVYDAQVLLATHSPVVLSTVEAEQILCFSKNADGATNIIRGSEHPALRSWKHETTLGTLFAAGVLG
ncbi:MAG TPA: ATP-binding protein [Thermoanaerobaculia bacterium]|jgi:predicted ATPase